jgi:hypothetical protein
VGEGKTQNQPHVFPTFGYLRSSACGTSTPARSWLRSADQHQLRRRLLLAERLLEARGQHDDAILVALGLANDDHLAAEVDVFDAQAEGLVQAHAGAIQQPRHECGGAFHGTEQANDLAGRQHRRDQLGRRRAL